MSYFTLILWNPTLFQADNILKDIPNIIEKKNITIAKNDLHDFIFDVYKLDTRCTHNVVLPPKIEKLKQYEDNHLVAKFIIDKPTYSGGVCHEAVRLKEKIRKKYKSNIKGYIRDIIIHVADNFQQSTYIWENVKLLKQPKIRKSLQEQCVYPFLKNFIQKLNLNIDLENLEIYHSLNHKSIGSESDIYVRKETHDVRFWNPNNIKLFIDSIDDKEMAKKVTNYYHIPYGAISYYLRDFNTQSWYNLIKPLNQICSQQKKENFCDYIFLNKRYRNGVKRWKFCEILNEMKHVNNFKTKYRFDVSMYHKVVEAHVPYRFSIAFENDIVDGWITEKIFNSFLAGCIPIYDGTDDIYKYFNKDSFINAKDFDSLEELAKYVIKVDSDEKLYNQYINKAPTTIEKLQKLFWWEPILGNK